MLLRRLALRPHPAAKRSFCGFSALDTLKEAHGHISRLSASGYASDVIDALLFNHRLMQDRREVSPAVLAATDAALGTHEELAHPHIAETVARACFQLHVYPPGFLQAWAASITRDPALWKTRQLRRVLPLVSDGCVASDPATRAASATFITESCRVLLKRSLVVGERDYSDKMRIELADACRIAIRAALTLPGGLLAESDAGAIVADLVCALRAHVSGDQMLRKLVTEVLGPWGPSNFVALSAAINAHNQGLLAPRGAAVAKLRSVDFSADFPIVPGPIATQPQLKRRNVTDPLPTAADHAIKRHVSALCADAGLPPPEEEVLLSCGITVDFVWPEMRVVLEADGPVHGAPISVQNYAADASQYDAKKFTRQGSASGSSGGVSNDSGAAQKAQDAQEGAGAGDWGRGSTSDIDLLAAAHGAEARALGRGPGVGDRDARPSGSSAVSAPAGRRAVALVLPRWRCPGLLHTRRWGIEESAPAAAEAAAAGEGGEDAGQQQQEQQQRLVLAESPLTRLRNAALLAAGWSVVQVVLPTAAAAAASSAGAVPALVQRASRGWRDATNKLRPPARLVRVSFAAEAIARARASSDDAAAADGVREAVLTAMRLQPGERKAYLQ